MLAGTPELLVPVVLRHRTASGILARISDGRLRRRICGLACGATTTPGTRLRPWTDQNRNCPDKASDQLGLKCHGILFRFGERYFRFPFVVTGGADSPPIQRAAAGKVRGRRAAADYGNFAKARSV